MHSRTFDRKRDADSFDADLKRRARMGDLDLLDAGRETLATFAREWWRLHAEPKLAQTTRSYYATAWDVHVLPRLGGLELRRITPEVIEAFQGDLRAAGVGAPTIRKVLSILQGVMTRAVVLRKITANPVTPIRKPTQARARTVRPLAPAVVEQLRSELLIAMPCWCRFSRMRVSAPARRSRCAGATCASGRSSSNVPSRSES